ncbi:Uncharacterised protein [Mycobacterium tuberculosis]|nr:Uncharacterised protein [Mycobacterium tuberculosis]
MLTRHDRQVLVIHPGRGHIASSKHRRHPDHPQVVVDLQASQPITGYRQLLGQAAGPHAGAPHHGGRCQPFPR